MAEILGEAPEALSNSEIIKRYGSHLDVVTKAATDPTYDFERSILISQARQQWLMVKGNPNPVLGWGPSDYGGQQASWIPFDYTSSQEETGADVKLCPPINFIGGDCFKFMAVMGSSSPRVKGVADDLRDQGDIATAYCADTNIRDLWIKNKIDRLWKIAAFHMYTTGPCFMRGYWNTDKVKYGETQEPKIEIVFGEDGVPIPKVVGTQSYANGDAEVSFHSVLEVTIPWEAKELRGNFLCCERMMSKWALLAKYPGKNDEPGPLDQYRGGDVPDDKMSGATVAAQEAKTATSNPSMTAQSKRPDTWRFTEWWVPPYLYEAVTSGEAREVLKRQFSRGLYIARVGSVVVEIEEREVTDEWTVCGVNRGEKIMERPVCADNVPIQRAINDLMGMAIETILRAITQTIIDNQLIDRQAMSTREAIPAEMILTAMPPEGDLRAKIFQIPPAHLSDQALPLLNLMRSMGQDISGVRPELSGGGQPTSTYREAKQRKDQALAQLAPQAQAMRDAAEDLGKILVNLRAKYGSGIVKSQRRGAYGVETDVANMEDLKETGWHPESDDQFPLTLSDKRDSVYSLIKEMPPEVQAFLGVLDVLNVEELCELLQVPGFQSAIADQKKKTLAEIDELMAQEPVMQEPGPDGQVPPAKSSIPIDPYDNHQVAAAVKSRWLIANQQVKGTPGFANVEASWTEQNEMAQPPQPPPPPPVKGSLSMSAKLEDFPNLMPQVMEAAGMQPPPPPAPIPQQPLAGGPQNLTGAMTPDANLPPITAGPQPPQGAM
jgi:hypothetical protein